MTSELLLVPSFCCHQQNDPQITAELAAERVARKALTNALMICIRYADSSADTEQAHAALALAARLP